MDDWLRRRVRQAALLGLRALLSLSCGGLLLAAHRAPAADDVLRADLGRAPVDVDRTCEDLRTPPTRWGVLILGAEREFASAERKARAIAEQLGIRFSSEGVAADPASGAGSCARRYSDGTCEPRTWRCADYTHCITVEDSSGYESFTPGLYIIVGLAGGEETMSGSLDLYRAVVPDAYVKYSTLWWDEGGYGGTSACQDWDVIVLARTHSLSEADAIARHVSARAGIPYTPRTPEPSTDEYYSQRAAPFPNISVEADDAYGDPYASYEGSPYFLVIGGELGEGEGTSAELLDRYRKVAPGAYRMKRARHVCGQ